jgi:hypothetical protein
MDRFQEVQNTFIGAALHVFNALRKESLRNNTFKPRNGHKRKENTIETWPGRLQHQPSNSLPFCQRTSDNP